MSAGQLSDDLRLYFESYVRLCAGTSPSTMSDHELLGVVGFLPPPPVQFDDWAHRVGIDSATGDDPGTINDAAIRARKLRDLERESRATPKKEED